MSRNERCLTSNRVTDSAREKSGKFLHVFRQLNKAWRKPTEVIHHPVFGFTVQGISRSNTYMEAEFLTNFGNLASDVLFHRVPIVIRVKHWIRVHIQFPPRLQIGDSVGCARHR